MSEVLNATPTTYTICEVESGGDADEQNALRFASHEMLGDASGIVGRYGGLYDPERNTRNHGGVDDARAAGV